jgi:hypothetical protein
MTTAPHIAALPTLVRPSARVTKTTNYGPPTIAVKAERAALSLDISLGSFLTLVREGIMPRPITVPGHSGLVLYDFEAVRNAWHILIQAGETDDANEWDQP